MERMKTIISEMSHLLSQITNEHKDYDGCVKKLKQIEDNVFYYYYYYKYHSSFLILFLFYHHHHLIIIYMCIV